MDLARRILARWRRVEALKAPYAAVFLDDLSQRRLVTWWNNRVQVPLLGAPIAHHMTIKFDPSPDELRAIPIGSQGKLQVIGYAADERGQAVLVRSNVRSHNANPHVTVSVAPGTDAVYSNDLLKRSVVYVQGPQLTGTVGVET
jgi:hypothetical protein